MLYDTMHFELGVRDTTGLAANFHAADRGVTSAMKDVVSRGLELVRDVTRQLVPVDTGFMRDHVMIYRAPSGLAGEVGWDAGHFINAGLAFYPVFVEFGTRFMAARPSLGQAYRYAAPIIHADARAILRTAIERVARTSRNR